MVQTNLSKLRVKCLNPLSHNTVAQARSIRNNELVTIEVLHERRKHCGWPIKLGTKSVVFYDRVGSCFNRIFGKSRTTKVNNHLGVHVIGIRSPSVRLHLLSQEAVELFRYKFFVTEVQTLVQGTQNPKRSIFDSTLHYGTNHCVYKSHLVSYGLGNTKVFHQLSSTNKD